MRLQKYMAKSGLTSRRKAEAMILEGRVKVDGRLVQELGSKVGDSSRVEVDGRVISLEKDKIYLALNKPKGYVTTMDDELKRKKVSDLIEGFDERIYPVGRLDLDTHGLILMTNDGDLTFRLTHPSFEMKKTYLALVEGRPRQAALEEFKRGLVIDGKLTYPAQVKVVETLKDQSRLEIKIHEGRNRQVRKMCDKINHPVIDLQRLAFGPIELGDLGLGQYRSLTSQEIASLKSIE